METREQQDLVLVNQPDQPTRLQIFRGQLANIDLAETVRRKAKQAFDTGNPEQSAICITEHLSDEQFGRLREISHFTCTVCGHVVKDRRERGC
jgi:hypothetical protein